MIRLSSYTPETYPFPNKDIDPKKKLEPDYCKRNAEAIYALYLSNGTAWGYGSGDYFTRMRQYSDGMQDTSQYQSFIKNSSSSEDNSVPTIFDTNDFTKEAKRKGYLSLMFQNLSPAAKIMNSLHGLMDKFDYDILADTIDVDSRGLIEFMKYKKMFEVMDAPFANEFKSKAGIPIEQSSSYFPGDKEELDAYEAREGFKLNVAKCMQKLLRYSFHDSKWDSCIRKKILDDLISTGYATTMDYFDEETQTFKVKWLDPAKTILQKSDEFDYADSEYGGYYDTITISNLRTKRPDLTEEQLMELAKLYKGQHGNPRNWSEKVSKIDPATQGYGYDGWNVDYFTAYWIDKDTYKSIYWKGKGNERIIDIGFDSKVTPLTESQKTRGFKQDIRKTPVRIVYQCSWVVGSDVVFDYGKYHMAARPKMTKPKIPIHAEQLLQSSIIYRLVPILDHIAITWLQFQNDLANMIQRGYAINMAMLMNITMNGKELDPASVLTMWKQKGLLPYMPSMSGGYEGGVPTPITPIEGGLGKRVEETATALAMYYKSIEDIVGINPLSLGATPDPDAPVSTSEAALRATSNVLKPIMDALFEEKESLAESLCLCIQIGLRVSDTIRKSYAGIVNPTDIQTMILAEQSGTKYGIILRARPDDKQRATIIRYMEIAIQQGELSATEAMYFSERIDSGADVTEIRQEMDYSIQQNKKKAQAEKMALVDQQNQGLAQIEQQKGQMTAQQTVLDTQSKVAEENVRGQNKVKVLTAEKNYEYLNSLLEGAKAEQGLTTGGVSKK